uniref:Uncharacterized protein n=1 Tax=Picea glauca TaxID=3330 RepID=A0A101LWR4_PICGL|nr:hypothetical protein ABT39_MTgene1422 [Picea glauca]
MEPGLGLKLVENELDLPLYLCPPSPLFMAPLLPLMRGHPSTLLLSKQQLVLQPLLL